MLVQAPGQSMDSVNAHAQELLKKSGSTSMKVLLSDLQTITTVSLDTIETTNKGL